MLPKNSIQKIRAFFIVPAILLLTTTGHFLLWMAELEMQKIYRKMQK